VAAAASTSADGEPALRPALLTRRAADVLTRVERMLDDAARGLVGARPLDATTGQGASLPPPSATAERQDGTAVRGN
jgi:hypothetical protein